ncbi:MAG: N-6 DNA methylase [Alphaproteobacteria bacterium]
MANHNTIIQILGDKYKLEEFTEDKISRLENNIIVKQNKTKTTYHVICLVRQKEVVLKPEEVIRQLYLMVLIEDYGYSVSRIKCEYPVSFGRETKKADIVIMDKDKPTDGYMVVEVKSPKFKDGKNQLKSYTNATGAPIAVWCNGSNRIYWHRKDPNFFEEINNIPNASQKLSDVIGQKWLLDDLIKNDELKKGKRSLKDLIVDMEDEVLANAGVDVFEEMFKLIFIKLYDEFESARDPKRFLIFKNYGDTDTELQQKLQNLFIDAKKQWVGVFDNSSKIELNHSHLSICVASLEKVKLFNSVLDVVDDAFEYLVSKSAKGEKGQYFTPRYVIDMCVKMLNPTAKETMIDSASGSCGFPIHSIFHVWEKLKNERGDKDVSLYSSDVKKPPYVDYVQKNVFAIDFDDKVVRVARTLNLIAGDGESNVLFLNTLDYEKWDEKIKEESWQEIYINAWNKFKKFRVDSDSNCNFNFDILMANPPFAGEIKESRILAKYELGKTNKGMPEKKVGRDILFIERNLQLIKDGGRMAIVLPQGRFNNSSNKYIRDYIADRCRILAVVGLHGNVFKPHTGTKTSILFLQKWHPELCPRVDDYNIFFATMQKPSKDSSGDKIYLKDSDGNNILDNNGHLMVDHDLFNHDNKTKDGIAEAFIEFAKREKLSFF